MPPVRRANGSWPQPPGPPNPQGSVPAGGKGLTLDLPGSLIKPRPLEAPVAGLGRRSLPPCPLAPRQPPTGFHLLTGGRFTADHPGPSTRLRFHAVVKSRV